MIIKQKIGNIATTQIDNRVIELLCVEWHETTKRIQHKHTAAGRQVTLKFLQQNPDLKEGDILWMDDATVIVVSINVTKAIVIHLSNIMEAASICYEIGNKHLPLYYEGDNVMVPYDAPLFNLLSALNYTVTIAEKKLIYPIKTTVLPHTHNGNTGLFTKILQLTNS